MTRPISSIANTVPVGYRMPLLRAATPLAGVPDRNAPAAGGYHVRRERLRWAHANTGIHSPTCPR